MQEEKDLLGTFSQEQKTIYQLLSKKNLKESFILPYFNSNTVIILFIQVNEIKFLRMMKYEVMLLELYIKYKKSFSTTPPFDGTKCNVDLLIEDFINQMSVLYSKGHFILGKNWVFY